MDNCWIYSILRKEPYIVISYATQLYYLSIKVKIIFVKTLKKNYFEIQTGKKHKAYSDTDYGSYYNKIFEKNCPELDGQIPPIDELDI